MESDPLYDLGLILHNMKKDLIEYGRISEISLEMAYEKYLRLKEKLEAEYEYKTSR